jgi:hypothetical protein
VKGTLTVAENLHYGIGNTRAAFSFSTNQPKWYGKSLSGLCMDNIVDNMEKWTASRSSELVSCHFYHLREYEIVGYCYYCYFIMLFGLHTAYHCLEYMTEYLLENYSLTEDMFDLHLQIICVLDVMPKKIFALVVWHRSDVR